MYADFSFADEIIVSGLPRLLRREDIIESVFDEEAFARLPALLAESVGARSTILHWTHHDGGYEALGFSPFTPEWMNEYRGGWVLADPWHAVGRARRNEIGLLEEAVPQRVFSNSPIFNDFICQYGDDTLHCMGVSFSTPWGVGALGLHRGAYQATSGTDPLATCKTDPLGLMVVAQSAGRRARSEALPTELA